MECCRGGFTGTARIPITTTTTGSGPPGITSTSIGPRGRRGRRFLLRSAPLIIILMSPAVAGFGAAAAGRTASYSAMSSSVRCASSTPLHRLSSSSPLSFLPSAAAAVVPNPPMRGGVGGLRWRTATLGMCGSRGGDGGVHPATTAFAFPGDGGHRRCFHGPARRPYHRHSGPIVPSTVVRFGTHRPRGGNAVSALTSSRLTSSSSSPSSSSSSSLEEEAGGGREAAPPTRSPSAVDRGSAEGGGTSKVDDDVSAEEVDGNGVVNDEGVGREDASVRLREARERLDAWRSDPNLEGLARTITLPTVVVPASSVHTLMKDDVVREYMPLKRLEGIHPRIKMVRDLDLVASPGGGGGDCGEEEGGTTARKILLLDPDAVLADDAADDRGRKPAPTNVTDHVEGNEGGPAEDLRASLHGAFPGLSPEALSILSDAGAFPGPDNLTLMLGYDRLPLSTVLSTLLPPEANPPPVSFETVGHVAHFNLRERHVPFGGIIGTVVLDKLSHSGIRTVVNKVGEVGGKYRTYEMDLLAGEPDFDVTVVEDGITLKFDVRNVYWCTRLGGERSRLMTEEFGPNQVVADAFCGVGAVCVQAAVRLGCEIMANDWNPQAVESCRENARSNGIGVANPGEDVGGDGVDLAVDDGEGRFSVRCGDARDFIRSLGMEAGLGGDDGGGGGVDGGLAAGNRPRRRTGRWERRRRRRRRSPSPSTSDNAPPVSHRRHQLPHHLLLNHPSDAPSFLDQLRWWPPPGDEGDVVTTVHVYTFARADDLDDDDDGRRRTAAEAAVDLVASNLLPEGGASQPRRFRRDELDGLGCEVRVREVRDVAPGKVVMCVRFRATGTLIRHMQGDYVDV